MKSRNAILILLALGGFVLCQEVQALDPQTPDPGSVGGSFNTADGTNALAHVTTGAANAAFGWFSLFSNTDGTFNTALGAATLVLSVGDQTTGEGVANTAIGAAALLFNATGFENTAVGAAALLNNTEGDNNNAVGFNALRENTIGRLNNAHGREALMANVDGVQNNAFGDQALANVVSGDFNTAVGDDAGTTITSGSVNVCIGADSGFGITTGSNIIAIGAGVSGISSVFGEVDDSCYIGNISGAGVDPVTAVLVAVDADGKLGVKSLADGHGFSLQDLVKDHRKVQELEITVAQLTAQFKEQAAQIQKVSVQLEASKPASQVVVNDQ
jgi:hypothetical protein